MRWTVDSRAAWRKLLEQLLLVCSTCEVASPGLQQLCLASAEIQKDMVYS